MQIEESESAWPQRSCQPPERSTCPAAACCCSPLTCTLAAFRCHPTTMHINMQRRHAAVSGDELSSSFLILPAPRCPVRSTGSADCCCCCCPLTVVVMVACMVACVNPFGSSSWATGLLLLEDGLAAFDMSGAGGEWRADGGGRAAAAAAEAESAAAAVHSCGPCCQSNGSLEADKSSWLS